MLLCELDTRYTSSQVVLEVLESCCGDGWLAIGLDVLTSVRRSARLCRVGVGDLATSGSLEVLSGPSVGQQGDACNVQMPATWRMPASSESVEDLDSENGALQVGTFARVLLDSGLVCASDWRTGPWL